MRSLLRLNRASTIGLAVLLATSAWRPALVLSQEGVPGAPIGLTARVLDSTVLIAWRFAAGPVPERYVVEAAMSPGGPVVASLPLAAPPLIVNPVPNGTYYVRVRALNSAGTSEPSAELAITVPCGSPSPPENLTQSGVGGVFSLAWNRPSVGCFPTGYRIGVGSASGSANLGTLSVGFQTSLRVPAPPGTYFARVVGVNTSGASTPSNEVMVTVDGACAPPGPPDRFTADVTGTTVSLRWQPPNSGGWPAGYVIEAGSDPGTSNLAVVPVGGLTFSAQAGDGAYFLRVKATNACGTSPASVTQLATIGTARWIPVTFTTTDGVRLQAAYAPPPAGAPGPVLLVLHEAFESHRSWEMFAVVARRRGYGVLAPDFRGHGESSGSALPYSALSMSRDVDAALAWLRSRPEVNPARIGVAGASLGANLAMQGGADHADVKSLALLSPGLSLYLLGTYPAIVDYGTRPLLMVAAEGHIGAAASVRELAPLARGPVETRFYEGAFDGTQLLRAYPDLNTLLLDYFDRTIP